MDESLRSNFTYLDRSSAFANRDFHNVTYTEQDTRGSDEHYLFILIKLELRHHPMCNGNRKIGIRISLDMDKDCLKFETMRLQQSGRWSLLFSSTKKAKMSHRSEWVNYTELSRLRS